MKISQETIDAIRDAENRAAEVSRQERAAALEIDETIEALKRLATVAEARGKFGRVLILNRAVSLIETLRGRAGL